MSKFTLKEIASKLKLMFAIIVCAAVIYICLQSDNYEEGEGPTFFYLFLILSVLAIDWITCKIKECYHTIKNRFFHT